MPKFPLIPGYRIEKELGRGGMATVYLAVQERLNRRVAIKVLSPLLLQDQNFARRFLKEAETAANLHHAGIIAVHDVGEAAGTYYIVMEFLAAGSLKEKINKGPVPPAEALAIIEQMASALDYAHGKGFIHRDIKPDNILFREDGTAVLTDFGIAKAVDSTTKLTKTGMSLGTPHYMSVEQLRGIEIDGRTDLYSLGIVLFEMLSGRVPYDAADTIAVAVKHIQEPVPRLDAELNAWQPLIDRLLAKDREQRFKKGGDLAAEIRSKLGGKEAPQAGHRASDDDLFAFQFARKLNTAEAYRFFLESYPDGSHSKEAGSLLSAIESKAESPESKAESAFRKARAADTKDDYIEYIRQYTESEFVQEAASRIAELESKVEKDDRRPAAVDRDPQAGDLPASRLPGTRSSEGGGSRKEPLTQGRAKVLVWEDDGWISKWRPQARRNDSGFWEIEDVNGTVLIYIPAGIFRMGSGADGAADERPQRDVWLDGYWIGKYPVTFSQFDYFCGMTGSYSRGVLNKKDRPDDNGWGRDNRPVTQVNCLEAILYCRWLSGVSGNTFDLPSEAQWEKAARGTDGRLYPWGSLPAACDLAQFNACQQMTVPVTEKPRGASPYGAMQMAGNIWEWCADYYDCSYYERATRHTPLNGDHSFLRVMRGGAFNSRDEELRCAERSFGQHARSENQVGFRVMMRPK